MQNTNRRAVRYRGVSMAVLWHPRDMNIMVEPGPGSGKNHGFHFSLFFQGRIAQEGEGVPPTPLPLFPLKWGSPSPPSVRATGGYPLPLRSRPGDPRQFPKKPHTTRLTPEVPREPQDTAMQKRCRMRTRGGGGTPPPPSPSFLQSGGHPPPHVPEQVGGIPPSIVERNFRNGSHIRIFREGRFSS